MNHAVLTAMIAYIDDLHRSADLNETFADDVAALARGIEPAPRDVAARDAMLALARRHRVDALKTRAKIGAVTDQFIKRFGSARFEQERSKRLPQPRRPI